MSASETEEVTRTVELPFRTYNTAKLALGHLDDANDDDRYADALKVLVNGWNDANEKRRNVGDENLAKLFAAAWIYDDGPVGIKGLAQLGRYAGIDQTVIDSAQKHAKEELVSGGDFDAGD